MQNVYKPGSGIGLCLNRFSGQHRERMAGRFCFIPISLLYFMLHQCLILNWHTVKSGLSDIARDRPKHVGYAEYRIKQTINLYMNKSNFLYMIFQSNFMLKHGRNPHMTHQRIRELPNLGAIHPFEY